MLIEFDVPRNRKQSHFFGAHLRAEVEAGDLDLPGLCDKDGLGRDAAMHALGILVQEVQRLEQLQHHTFSLQFRRDLCHQVVLGAAGLRLEEAGEAELDGLGDEADVLFVLSWLLEQVQDGGVFELGQICGVLFQNLHGILPHVCGRLTKYLLLRLTFVPVFLLNHENRRFPISLATLLRTVDAPQVVQPSCHVGLAFDFIVLREFVAAHDGT